MLLLDYLNGRIFIVSVLSIKLILEREMERLNTGLKEVQAVYDGPEGKLWELIMGEQIHVGGFMSSKTLADQAGIKAGMKGVDLCSALGAGCCFLVKNYDVSMCGVDATDTMISEAVKRTGAGGLSDRIEYRKSDVLEIPYPDGSFDFVWGEDAWCYVTDKNRLVREASRVLKPGGILAFTDWIEGPAGLSNKEAERINSFMKFPYMENMGGYKKIISDSGLSLTSAEDLTEEFAWFVGYYLDVLSKQLTYDALKIIGDDMELFQAMGGEMGFIKECAEAGKMGRGRFIARK